MSQDIIDLDGAGIFSPPLHVRILGEEYKLPGDVPAPLYVLMVQVGELSPDTPAAEQVEKAMELHEQVLALFREYQPDLAELPIPLAKTMQALTYVYGGAAERPAGPTRPARRSTRKATRSSRTPNARRSRRRSRS